jgi:hypothetical protein
LRTVVNCQAMCSNTTHCHEKPLQLYIVAGKHHTTVYAETTCAYDWTNLATGPSCLDVSDWIKSHHKQTKRPVCTLDMFDWTIQ